MKIEKAFEIVVRAAIDAGWSPDMVREAVDRNLPKPVTAVTTYNPPAEHKSEEPDDL